MIWQQSLIRMAFPTVQVETDTKKYIFTMYVLMSYLFDAQQSTIARLTNSHYF